jgi:hypothetical protein
MYSGDQHGLKVQYVSVGRDRREWMWKAKPRDEESKTITISGHRFGSLLDAVRDARGQISGLDADEWDDGPAVA